MRLRHIEITPQDGIPTVGYEIEGKQRSFCLRRDRPDDRYIGCFVANEFARKSPARKSSYPKFADFEAA